MRRRARSASGFRVNSERGFLTLFVLAVLGWASVAPAADHRDGPRFNGTGTDIRVTGNLDLNDLFVFVSPTNKNNSVLVLTTGGTGVGFVTPPTFCPGCLYEFQIDNNGDSLADITYTFIFSDPNAQLRQTVQMFSRTGGGNRILVAQGTTGRKLNVRGGGFVVADLYDDPFFFDGLALAAFNRIVARVSPGGPGPAELTGDDGLPERIAPFTGAVVAGSPESSITTPRPPNNFFANTNVLSIVLEIPRLKLQASSSNPNIRVWITDTLADQTTQFDRTALPGINPALIPPGATQDQFNNGSPSTDRAQFRDIMVTRLQTAFLNSPARAGALADALLPDIMPFNTTDRRGFNIGTTLVLNGRRLSDDVIDAELNLLTNGILTGDRVFNDSIFRRTFPYMGPPIPLRQTVNR